MGNFKPTWWVRVDGMKEGRKFETRDIEPYDQSLGIVYEWDMFLDNQQGKT